MGKFNEKLKVNSTANIATCFEVAKVDEVVDYKSLLCGASGIVSCVDKRGITTLMPVVAGYNPIGVRQINTVGTTVTLTSIIGLF